jgi:hypothetical protein
MPRLGQRPTYAITPTVFQRCVGKVFPIVGFQQVGSEKVWLELYVGGVMGKLPYEETIWIEPDCGELVSPSKREDELSSDSRGGARV